MVDFKKIEKLPYSFLVYKYKNIYNLIFIYNFSSDKIYKYFDYIMVMEDLELIYSTGSISVLINSSKINIFEPTKHLKIPVIKKMYNEVIKTQEYQQINMKGLFNLF